MGRFRGKCSKCKTRQQFPASLYKLDTRSAKFIPGSKTEFTHISPYAISHPNIKKKTDEENNAPQRDDETRGRQKPYNEELMSYLPSLNVERGLKTRIT